MVVINLSCTSLSGCFNSKTIKLVMCLHYTVHAIMDIIPDVACNVKLAFFFGRIFFYQISLGIGYTVQKRKLVDVAMVVAYLAS